jgi:hypothetical protein
MRGQLTLAKWHGALLSSGPALTHVPTDFVAYDELDPPKSGFNVIRTPDMLFVTVPHWHLSLIFGGIGLVLLLKKRHRRFSLRTLLIAMTLIAVLLGIIANSN